MPTMIVKPGNSSLWMVTGCLLDCNLRVTILWDKRVVLFRSVAEKLPAVDCSISDLG